MRKRHLGCCFLLLAYSGSLLATREELLTASPGERQGRHGWMLTENGYFSRVRGLFFLDGNELEIYSLVTRGRNSVTGKDTLIGIDESQVVLWKGEPYFHETYRLVEGIWRKRAQEFSKAPAKYLNFSVCDENDEVDLARPEIRRAFQPWPGTKMKIKDVIELASGYAAVVYSEIPRQGEIAYRSTDRTIQVALLTEDKSGWRLADGIDGSQDPRKFCGTRLLSATESQGTHPVLLIFTTAGKFNAVDSYQLD